MLCTRCVWQTAELVVFVLLGRVCSYLQLLHQTANRIPPLVLTAALLAAYISHPPLARQPGMEHIVAGKGGQPKLVVVHAESGASVDVYLHGATITSWIAGGKERLLLSESAVFDGKKAIRGGIPVIFPQFAGMGPLPTHGFARNQPWTVASVGDGAAVLTLEHSAQTRAVWDFAFALEYQIRFDGTHLHTSLTAKNTGEAPFTTQALLHTYFRLHNALGSIGVAGLRGETFLDKLTNVESVQGAEEIAIAAETDCIYGKVTHGKPAATVFLTRVTGPASETSDVKLTFGSSVASADPALQQPETDVVVWNPWVEKSKRLDDFGDDEYHNMICVEPGIVTAPQLLQPGEALTLFQDIVVDTAATLAQ